MRLPPLVLLLAVSSLTGCMSRGGRAVAVSAAPSAPTGTVPAAPREFALYRGSDGAPLTLASAVELAGSADLVVIGEHHDHPEGSRLERALLDALSSRGRPVALAMEFFERDTQGAVDRWLAGDMDDATFAKETKRSPTYAWTHGPLLALAKERRLPVLAANAPRRLVSAWRKADSPDYATWLAGLPPEDRALLPRTTWLAKDDYWTRFQALMGGARAESFFRSQSLWDDAMAESISDFRFTHEGHQVVLVVGGFHVAGRLGTVTKYQTRRRSDRVVVLLMSGSDTPALPFAADDRGEADVILVVPNHPAPAPKGPSPHEKPKPEAPPPTT